MSRVLRPASVQVFAHLTVAFLATSASYAQDAPPPNEPEQTPQQRAMMEKFQSIVWEQGPMVAKISDIGEIQLPEGYKFTSAAGTQALLEAYGNPHNPKLLGAIVPIDEAQDWTLIFQFEDIGYVKDDDKDSIDADGILQGFKDGLESDNASRRAIGGEEIRDISWMEKPFYDPQTHNLTWALRLHFDTGDSVNYDIRVLGRKGVMKVTLLGSPETYASAVPTAKTLLSGYQFSSGNKYSEWTSGDKVAAYGLAGLVAGGAAAVAAKTGLLAKLGLLLAKGGKAIIVGVVAFVAVVGSLFRRLFSGRTSTN